MVESRDPARAFAYWFSAQPWHIQRRFVHDWIERHEPGDGPPFNEQPQPLRSTSRDSEVAALHAAAGSSGASDPYFDTLGTSRDSEVRDALAILDVIDGIVDDTHPEGDGCPLCKALDDLRASLRSTSRDREVAMFARLAEPIVRWYMENVADPEVVAKWAKGKA